MVIPDVLGDSAQVGLSTKSPKRTEYPFFQISFGSHFVYPIAWRLAAE